MRRGHASLHEFIYLISVRADQLHDVGVFRYFGHLDAVVDLIAGPPDMRRVTRFIIREQMHPTEAFDAIFDSLSRVHAAACSFFAAATGRSPEDPETRLHVFMLLGQAQMLRIAEAAILRRMQIDHYDAAFLARVKSLLRGNVRSIVAAASRGGGR